MRAAMKKLGFMVATAVLLSALPRARADEWYGWQILIADAVSTGVFFAGANAGGDGGNALMSLGAAGFVLGGPAIHVAHADYANAGIDLGLRAGLTVGGSYIGARVGDDG